MKWKLKEEGGTNARDKDIPDSVSELQTFFWRVGTPAYQEKLENAAAIIARVNVNEYLSHVTANI